MPKHPQAVGHWSTLVEGLQASPRECYAEIIDAIRRRKIPDAATSLVTHKESGFLSAERIYLQVNRKMLAFDICAAPFGTGFFFSWRLSEVPPGNLLGCFTIFLMLGVSGFLLQFGRALSEDVGHPLNLFQVAIVAGGLVLGTLWVAAVAIRSGRLFSEDAVLAMPLIGSVYSAIFRPFTYYKEDTIDMYQKAVHAAVLEVVDGIMSAKGLRALSPEERKPTLRSFLGRR